MHGGELAGLDGVTELVGVDLEIDLDIDTIRTLNHINPPGTIMTCYTPNRAA